MAIPIYRVNILGRSGTGPSPVGASAYASGKVLHVTSMVAAASYRAGEPLRDHQLAQTFDYSGREDVKFSEILAPAHAPAWVYDREALWNAVEQRENRSNSQLARSIVIALPRELPLEQNIALMREHLQEQFVSKGMVIDWSIHEVTAKDGKPQPHCHVLATMREFNSDGTWAKNKTREWNGYDANGRQTGDVITAWRDAWENTQNAFLEEAGSDARVSMKSYKDQGIDKLSQLHMGPKNWEMERKGKETAPGNYNRMVAQTNKALEAVKGWINWLRKPDKAQQHKREYTIEDINAYYAKTEAAHSHVYEPKPEDMKKEESRRQEQKQEQPKAEWNKEPRREAQADAPKPPDNRPRRVASPEDRDHYKAMRPFLQNQPWDSRQDMLHFIAVTSKYMHQRKAEARRDPFERLAGTRDSQRFRAVWQDRPIPQQGRERSRGGRER